MRVMLADDAVVIRQGLARLLADQHVDVVAQAGSADELMPLVAVDPPDVVVLDIKMPPTYRDEGLVAAHEIHRLYPDVGTLVLSQYVDVDYALTLLTGASARVGYLLKDRVADVADFIAALQRITDGGTVIDPELINELLTATAARDPISALTPREREVLALVAQGRTDRGISTQLFITTKTVEAHVRSIFGKLDLPIDSSENRRVHAVLAFLQFKEGAPRAVPER
jgi:DNA-binding NarL/FixJ family response regulator